jgi:hypothetical protein
VPTIVEWLESLGLSEYAEAFSKNDTDVAVLPHLTDQDLKEMDVSLGHRRKMLAAITELAGARRPVSPDEPRSQDTATRRQTELNKVIKALRDLYAQETFLFDKDVGERTITHRFAVHLEKQFPGWSIDCNYDRLGERTLHLPRGTIISTDDHLGKSIYPDVVVHQREIPNNLLAIEIRNANNHTALEHDKHKLKALTDPDVWFAYGLGVLLVLARSRVTLSEVYVGGARDQTLTAWFAGKLDEVGLGAPR